MKKKDLANFIFFLIVFANLSNCAQSRKTVTFANVCQEENHSKVEIRGYLHLPNETTGNQVLLVENSNETGSFIQIANSNPSIISSNNGVKVTGEVLKEGNLCVLKVEKIETP